MAPKKIMKGKEWNTSDTCWNEVRTRQDRTREHGYRKVNNIDGKMKREKLKGM